MNNMYPTKCRSLKRLFVVIVLLFVYSGYFGSVSAQVVRQVARSIAWSPDGQQIAVGGTFGVRFYSSSLQALPALNGAEGNVTFVAWNPKGRQLAVASLDNSVKIWDVVDGSLLLTLQGHTDQIWSISWSPDGARIASASKDKTVRIWDTHTGALLTTLSHPEKVWTVTWSPDGARIASGGGEPDTVRSRFIQIWDSTTYTMLVNIDFGELPSGAVGFLAWKPDSTQLASIAGGVQILDVQTGHLVQDIPLDGIDFVAWSPDSKLLLTTSVEPSISIRDLATGVFTPDLRGHQAVVIAAAWSSDSREVVTISEDGTIRKWNATTGQQLVFALLPSITLGDLQYAISVCAPDEETQNALKEYMDGNQLDAFIREVNRSVPAVIDAQCAEHLIKVATYLLGEHPTPTLTATASPTLTETSTR
jgi:WD40 repeat protein